MSKGLGITQVINGLTIGGSNTAATVRAPTSGDHSSALAFTGTLIQTDDGRYYRYFKANEAIAINMVVTFLSDITITNATAAASDNTLSDTGSFTADRYNIVQDDWYVGLNGNTGAGQVRKIISNTADVLTLDTAWATAIDTTTDGITFSPYVVEQADAANEKVIGVAISAITSGQYGWFQTHGFCPLVRFAGDTDPSAAHEGLVSSATSGVAKGLTTAGTTADEADKAFGYAYYAYAVADVAARGVAAFLKCE